MDDENILDFNFWPSFADLMLSLVFVMVITMFAFIFYFSLNTVNLKDVENNQMALVEQIAKDFNTDYIQIENNTYDISLNKSITYDIRIVNDAKIQHVSFNTMILFQQDDYKLNDKGKNLLKEFGSTLKSNLFRIDEIQIQGHADSNQTKRYRSNLELAAMRSIEVFNYLQEEVGIDPSKSLMSITSFGEYRPVNRKSNDGSYSYEKLLEENNTQEKRDINRRIEILLFYQ